MATNTLAALSKRHCSRYVAFHSAETYFLMTVQILCSKNICRWDTKSKNHIKSICSLKVYTHAVWFYEFVMFWHFPGNALLCCGIAINFHIRARFACNMHFRVCVFSRATSPTSPPEESRELVLYSGLPLLVGCARADVIAKSESIWSIEAAVGRKAGASVSVWSLNIPATCWVWKAASDLPFWGKTNTDCRSLHRFGCLGLERAASCSVE